VPDPGPIEDEITIAAFKKYESPGSDQIPTKQMKIRRRRNTVRDP
jgi:hypothetical protein